MFDSQLRDSGETLQVFGQSEPGGLVEARPSFERPGWHSQTRRSAESFDSEGKIGCEKGARDIRLTFLTKHRDRDLRMSTMQVFLARTPAEDS